MGSLRGLRVGSDKVESVVEVYTKGVYLGLFDDFDTVVDKFYIPDKEANRLRRSAKVLFAIYEYEDYSGSAYVLYKEGDKYFEVYGSHCS
jgi:hypothetical protein